MDDLNKAQNVISPEPESPEKIILRLKEEFPFTTIWAVKKFNLFSRKDYPEPITRILSIKLGGDALLSSMKEEIRVKLSAAPEKELASVKTRLEDAVSTISEVMKPPHSSGTREQEIRIYIAVFKKLVEQITLKIEESNAQQRSVWENEKFQGYQTRW
jgi:hypothetical protein